MVATANAALVETSPIKVCSFLKEVGLATRGWKNLYENQFSCSSRYKEIGTGFPMANNLAYYVEGESSLATQAKLVLNINNKSETSSAYSELINSSEVLSKKITGEKLPSSISTAIKSGKPIQAKLGKSTIEITRDNWPTGKGYELHVLFK
ncbi:hypothetical protein [Methylovorus sp. MM2]|uniref:hypothetical protein n=1 Tax=Methylovorus sp. MM2 TaxID=1848038 RepID=UPI0013F4D6BA|nr:hypothetical protein [Methylovorus sp. MM2]